MNQLIEFIVNIAKAVVPFFLAIAVLLFFWGLLMYLLNLSDKDKREEGVNIMLIGTIVNFFCVLGWIGVNFLEKLI